MAIVYMTENTQSNKSKGSPVWEYSAILDSGGAGDSVLLPDEAGKITDYIVGLIISTGNGRIEYSKSKRADIIAGTADWIAWDAGNVSVSTDDTLTPPNAVRAFRISGTIKIEVIAS